MTGTAPNHERHRRRLGSTYRLQLSGLGFARAARLVPYLDALGVETLYVSPVTMAVPGSTHGYDVVDPTRLDPALGSADELDALLAALAGRDMRLLIDVVPNHMAAAAANPWWWDVLARGRGSPFAPYFDIDWTKHEGRVLLPVLGRSLAAVIADGELSVAFEAGVAVLSYYDHRFPIGPGTPARLVRSLVSVRPEPSPEGILAEGSSDDSSSDDSSADDSSADDCYADNMTELLGHQHYRLASWRLGRHEGNYRRFFDVDGLVGVRVEDPAVYEATHALLLRLADDDRVAGLRVDHVDGLADPTRYLAQLGHDLDRGERSRPVLLVEKILARDESLPSLWTVDGTTGYEFVDLAGSLLVDGDGAEAIAKLAADWARDDRPFDQLATASKRFVQASLFPGQVARLTDLVAWRLSRPPGGHDLARPDLSRALVELAAQLGVYRTYVDATGATGEDRRRLQQAAIGARPNLDGDGQRAMDLILPLLGADEPADPARAAVGSSDPGRAAVEPGDLELVQRWQQHTGAVTAKGVEDTALYRSGALAALTEVGTDPGRPPVTVDRFHQAMGRRRRTTRHSLSATSTHDTKQSEDVRSRLAVLAELPATWEEHVSRWHGWHRSPAGAPDPPDELFAYQTIVGAWPLDPDDRRGFSRRVQDYMVKALREAKVRTSWLRPDDDYERVVRAFIRRILSPSNRRFHADLGRLLDMVGPAGAVNALAMTVLKCTVPGVPDVYQGTELWSHSLVDPDNRRPVDFERRARMVDALDRATDGESSTARFLASWPDGRLKLMVTQRLLRLRRSRPNLFDRGSYLPLEVEGPRHRHVVAFARHRRSDWAVIVVPRLPLSLAGAGRMPVGPALWRGTSVALPGGAPSQLIDVLTGSNLSPRGARLPVGEMLATLPWSVSVGP